MITLHRFNSIAELQRLQELAGTISEDVFLHSLDDSIMVDAKSFINLFTLDFSQEVKIVSENERIHKIIAKW